MGHCVRHPEEAAHHTHGRPRKGAPCMSYVTLLKKDTGLDSMSTHEIETVILQWSGPLLQSFDWVVL